MGIIKHQGMKSAAATWSRGLYRPIRAFCHWGLYIPLLLTMPTSSPSRWRMTIIQLAVECKCIQCNQSFAERRLQVDPAAALYMCGCVVGNTYELKKQSEAQHSRLRPITQ